MPAHIVNKRARFFVAVEGQSEQSFIRWLKDQSDEEALCIHLDCHVLGGGGFKSMLQKAVRFHKKGLRIGSYQDRFLVVDSDRADQGDWTIEELRNEAGKHRFNVFVQKPNHEGLLLRMLPGREREIADVASAEAKLKTQWPNYQKPMDARALGWKFSLDDLLRVANVDKDLRIFLERIGFK